MIHSKTLRHFVPALAIVVAVAAPAVVRADAVPAPDDSFQLTLPEGFAAFTKQAQSATSPEGEINTTNWISKSTDGSAIVVTMSRMPGPILDPAKLMDSTRESLLKSLSATLENEERAEKGSSLLFKSAGAFFRSRFEVRDDRFYQLLYVARSDEGRTTPAAAQVFDSFAVAETAAPAETAPAAAAPAEPATATK